MMSVLLAFEIMFIIVVLVFGLSVGSFCNNWAYRLCRGESVANGRSKCPQCHHTLHTKDLIPFFSYLTLKGRCRYCQVKIPNRYFLVEVVSGILYLLLWFNLNPTDPANVVDFYRWAFLLFFLITLTLQDLETYELDDDINFAGFIWFLVVSPFAGDLTSGLIGGLSISVPILLMSLVADKVLGKESMGGGDIKLFAMLGLHLGFPLTLLSLILSCFIGIFFAIVLRNKSAEEAGMIPFGPSICIASFITALWGEQLLALYLSLF